MFQDILAYSVYFDYKRFPLGLKDLLYSSCGGPAVAGMQGFTSLTEYVYFPAIVCLSPYTEYACPTIQSLCVTPYKVCCPLHSMIDPLHRMFVPLHSMIVPLHRVCLSPSIVPFPHFPNIPHIPYFRFLRGVLVFFLYIMDDPRIHQGNCKSFF